MRHSDLRWEDVRVLEVIEAEGGESLTSEIREHINFDREVLNCAESLVDEDLIEFTGKIKEREGQRPTNQYRITEQGWDAIAQGLTERVRPTVASKRFEWLESRVDRLEEKVEGREHQELVDTVQDLVRDVDTLKRDVQKRASEVQIETLSEEVESVNEELAILSARIKDKATKEELEEIRATVENNERYNTILKEWARAAAERDPNFDDMYNEFRYLIALLVALERYFQATDIDIWAYHPSNADEEEEEHE